jgi:hypothetical protein
MGDKKVSHNKKIYTLNKILLYHPAFPSHKIIVQRKPILIGNLVNRTE